jgi:L-2-hydroxyglutarate oxidase LhgO
MDYVDTIVVGAGVVGLAVGRVMAQRGESVIVLEAETHFGTGISSRNSEVIHAGIYYPVGSLKAQTCVEGKRRLYDYLATRAVPYRNCGKLIVATTGEQVAELEKIEAWGRANGVDDLQWRSGADVGRLEPDIQCVAALWSPSTGIIDTHAYMQALIADLEAAGGQLVFSAAFAGAEIGDGFVVAVTDTHRPDDPPYRLHCRRLINCAGLDAQDVARRMEGLEAACIPPLHYAKGTYFGLAGRTPFSHLIYPVPEPGGLGVHVTLDMAGQARFGPDVQWIDALDFDPDPARAAHFYGAIRRYYPALPDGGLVPAYCGIRPKLKGRGEGDSDFVISGIEEHGVAGLVNLFGIESPGLTASLAIAERVAGAARHG